MHIRYWSSVNVSSNTILCRGRREGTKSPPLCRVAEMSSEVSFTEMAKLIRPELFAVRVQL